MSEISHITLAKSAPFDVHITGVQTTFVVLCQDEGHVFPYQIKIRTILHYWKHVMPLMSSEASLWGVLSHSNLVIARL